MKIGTTFQLKTLREWLMLLCFFPLMVFAESEHVEITLSAPDAAVKNRFLCDSDLDQTLKVFFPYLHPNASKVVPLKTPKKLDLDDVFQRKNFDLFQVKKDPEPDLMGPTLEAYFNFILNRQVSYQPVDVQRLLERGNDTLLSLTPLLDDKKLRFVPEGTLPGQPARVLDRKSFLPQFTVEDESGHLFLRNKQSLGDDLEVVLDRGRLTLVPRPKHPEPERELEWDVLPNGAIQLTPKLSGMLRGTALGTDPQEPTDSPEAPFPFNDIARNPVFYENIDDVSHHRQILLATTAALKCGANSQLSYYLQKLLNQGTLSELPKGVHFSALVDKPPVETLVQLLRNENPRERDLWAEQLAKSVLQLIHPDISIGGGIHTPFAQWLSQTPKPDQKTQELINSKGMEYLVGALNSDYLRLKLKGENLPTVKSSPHFHWNETLKDKRLGPWHVLSDVPFSEHYPPSGQYFGKDIQRVLSNLIRDPSNPWHLNDMHYVAGRLKDIPFHSEIERDLMHEWVKERLGEINKGDFDDRIRTQREEGHSTGPRDWRRTLSLRHALGEFDKALRQSTVQAPAQELSEEEIEEQFGESWVKKPGKKVHAITAEHYRYRDPGLARREFRQTYEKVSPEIRAEMESIEKNLKEKADFALSNGAMTGILKLPAFHRNLLLKMLQHITPTTKSSCKKPSLILSHYP